MKKSFWRYLNEVFLFLLFLNFVCFLRDYLRSYVFLFLFWLFWLLLLCVWFFYWVLGLFVERIILCKMKILREFWNRFLVLILDIWIYLIWMFRILYLFMGIFKYNYILYFYWMYISLYMFYVKVKENKDIKNEKIIYLFYKDNNVFIWLLYMICYIMLYGK